MGLVLALAVMLLAIAGGQMADRFERRLIVMATLTLGTLSTAGLLTVAQTG
jgi:MFS family permease